MPRPPDLRESPYAADGSPDRSDPEFIEECRRQSRLVSESSGEEDDMDFIERFLEMNRGVDAAGGRSACGRRARPMCARV
jgi:hypothetical protein